MMPLSLASAIYRSTSSGSPSSYPQYIQGQSKQASLFFACLIARRKSCSIIIQSVLQLWFSSSFASFHNITIPNTGAQGLIIIAIPVTASWNYAFRQLDMCSRFAKFISSLPWRMCPAFATCSIHVLVHQRKLDVPQGPDVTVYFHDRGCIDIDLRYHWLRTC